MFWLPGGACALPIPPSAGGALLSPCECAGSLKYVHARCLQRWAAQQAAVGRRRALRCEICGQRWAAPGLELLEAGGGGSGGGSSEPPWPLVGVLAALRNSPCGRLYLAGAAVCAAAGCIHGAAAGLLGLPCVLAEARRRPAALLPLAKQLALGALAAPLTGLHAAFYAQAGLYYAAGRGLEEGAARLRCWAAGGGAQWGPPPALGGLLALPLWCAEAAGGLCEAFHLGLLSFLAGAQSGLLRGIWAWVALPFGLLGPVVAGAARAARTAAGAVRRRR